MNPLPLLFVLFLASCGQNPLKAFFDDNPPSAQVITPDMLSANESEYAANEYMVAFRLEDKSTHLLSQLSRNASFVHKRFQVNKYLYRNFVEKGGVKDIEYISQVNLTNPHHKQESIFEKLINLGLPAKTFTTDSTAAHISLVKFNSSDHAKSTLKKWADENKIWYAEPNWKSKLKDDALFSGYQTNYSDARSNYWINNTTISESMDLINSLSSEEKAELLVNPPVIAVLDSGADIEHNSLKDQIYTNTTYQNKFCLDDTYGCNTSTDFQKAILGDGNIHPVLTDGFSQSCPTGEEEQVCMHGTHVAGLVAATPDPTLDVYGYCPYCKLMIMRVVKEKTDASGNRVSAGITDSSILRALQYIALFVKDGQRVVRVINFSLGKYQKSRSVALLVRLLSESDAQRGVLVVGAASNEDSMSRSYPAALSDAIAVSAVNENNEKANFSNSGSWVDIAAPGYLINSTVPNQDAKQINGTSMAAPIVSGIAGLYYSLNPHLKSEVVKDDLLKSANPIIYEIPYNKAYYFPEVSGSKNNVPLLGTGLVDSYALINGTRYDVPELATNTTIDSGCAALGTIRKDQSPPNTSNLLVAFLLFIPALMLIFANKPKRFTEE
jgi:subtilisin family serine protease